LDFIFEKAHFETYLPIFEAKFMFEMLSFVQITQMLLPCLFGHDSSNYYLNNDCELHSFIQ